MLPWAFCIIRTSGSGRVCKCDLFDMLCGSLYGRRSRGFHKLCWAASSSKRYMVHFVSIFTTLHEVRYRHNRRAELAQHNETTSESFLVMFNEVHLSWQLPRQILDSSVQWAMKADKSTFWRGARRPANKIESPRESVLSMRKGNNTGIAKNKSEE